LSSSYNKAFYSLALPEQAIYDVFMGQTEVDIKIRTGYTEADLERQIKKTLKLKSCRYTIIKKSLDSRRKDRIHWQMRLSVVSDGLKNGSPSSRPERIIIPRISGSPRVIIAGTGPAGIFSAIYLQKAGFRVTLLERGREVRQRALDIRTLETEGTFIKDSNYSFGEGGAGTFSDGKLTSRSKHIKKERLYILEEFVRNGAPEEILYLTHPHIGSDKLVPVAEAMRLEFLNCGGEIRFDCTLTDINASSGKVRSVATSAGELPADYFILATGHSALDTFRMLIGRGVPYIPKNFALGFRMEHTQERINMIQWGCSGLEGVKAAEYRLTTGSAEIPVYTFCMCPGGKVVPAAPFRETNIVNGMSYYMRDGQFANAAIVAGISPALIGGSGLTALQSLEWLESREQDFYRLTGDYRAPSMTIRDFISDNPTGKVLPSSYEPGLMASDLRQHLPSQVVSALQEGLRDFSARMPGWDEGQLMGLESKTSSPVQVVRNRENGLVDGFENLFICGEASGWTGGIISSASDGVRTAMALTSSRM